MKPIRVATIAALFISGQALGQSVITYTLQLGGNNNVSSHEDGNEPAYIGGNPADGQQIDAPGGFGIVNWDVTVAVSGIHSGGPGDGVPTNGLANAVFTLEIRQGSAGGPLHAVGRVGGTANNPTGEGFFSTINDGDADGFRGVLLGADPLANADFTRSFQGLITGNPDTPGRIYDRKTDRGPRLDRTEFPSCTGLPAGNTAALGTLVGMGAGYSQLVFGTGDVRTAGVGNAGNCALSVVSIAEGQIRLAPGNYCLVLVPGTGNNVLRGDFTCNQSPAPGSFAVAANQVQGDSICFTVGTVVGRTLVSAASRRTHGGAGAFDIAAPLSGTAASEPRQAGALPQMVLTYDSSPAGVTCGDYTVTNGTCTAVTVSGNTATMTLSGLAKNTCLTVQDNGALGDNNVSVRLAEGNSDNVGGINILDLTAVKNALLQAININNNHLKDVQPNGVINILDLTAVKNNLFAPSTCP